MKKLIICAVAIVIGLSFCIVSNIAASNVNGTDSDQVSFDYSIEAKIDEITKGTSGSGINAIKVDVVPFVVSKNNTEISKYTLKVAYDGTSFIVKKNSLALIDGFDNKVVVIPQSFTKVVEVDGTSISQEYTCETIETQSTKGVETLIIHGNPCIAADSSGLQTKAINVRSSPLRCLVFTGEPTYYSKMGPMIFFNDGIVDMPAVYFLSSSAKLPNTIALATEIDSSMDVYLESTADTIIPGKILDFDNTSFNPTENNCTNVNLHFSANAEVPQQFDCSSVTKIGKFNFIIDVDSPYWAHYLGSGNVASKVVLNENVIVHAIGDPSFQITLAANEGGTVKVDDRAAEGQTVIVQATPSEGYYLKELKYSYGETSQTISGSDGYRFTMPAHEVKITAVFEKCIPSIKAEHTVSGSKIGIDVDLEGKPTDGKVPAKISIYVRYSGDDGDRFATGSFSIPVYSGSYQVSFETSMTFGSPVSYLVQVFAADGVTCLNQKEVVITG